MRSSICPPGEQQQVVEFVHTLQRRPWSGEKLTEYEKRLVETNDPAEAQRLKEQIVAGFFGDERDRMTNDERKRHLGDRPY